MMAQHQPHWDQRTPSDPIRSFVSVRLPGDGQCKHESGPHKSCTVQQDFVGLNIQSPLELKLLRGISSKHCTNTLPMHASVIENCSESKLWTLCTNVWKNTKQNKKVNPNPRLVRNLSENLPLQSPTTSPWSLDTLIEKVSKLNRRWCRLLSLPCCRQEWNSLGLWAFQGSYKLINSLTPTCRGVSLLSIG
jgi:hypothetical protein